jgi:hypothetical protein
MDIFTHNDIAPTVSMLMGWRIPSQSIGKPITSGFILSEDRAKFYLSSSINQAIKVLSIIDSNLEFRHADNPYNLYIEASKKLYSEGFQYRLIILALPIYMTILIAIYLARYGHDTARRRMLATIALAIVMFEALYWITYTVIGGAYSLSDIKSFNGFIQTIVVSVSIAGAVSGLLIGLIELTPLRSGLRSSVRFSILASSSILVIQLYLSSILYISYGPVVRFPFPNWNDAIFYFIYNIKAAFTIFFGMPIMLTIAVSLSLLGGRLYRSGGYSSTGS